LLSTTILLLTKGVNLTNIQYGICSVISSSAKCFNHYKCTSKPMTDADSYTMDLDNTTNLSTGCN